MSIKIFVVTGPVECFQLLDKRPVLFRGGSRGKYAYKLPLLRPGVEVHNMPDFSGSECFAFRILWLNNKPLFNLDNVDPYPVTNLFNNLNNNQDFKDNSAKTNVDCTKGSHCSSRLALIVF